MTGIRTIDDVRARCRVCADTGCWVWALAYTKTRGSLVPVGYLPSEGGTLTAGRIAWKLGRGPMPQRATVVWAGCWTAGCVNPSHLRAGTHAQRVAQAKRDGRTRWSAKRSAANARSARSRSHLSEEIVAQILAGDLSNADIAEQYGVSKSQAWKIRTGRCWGPLPGSSVFALGKLKTNGARPLQAGVALNQ